MSPDGPPGAFATPGGYHSFEHRWALAEAFALHQAIGRTRIAERTHTLATALKDGLAGMPKVRLRTPALPSCRPGHRVLRGGRLPSADAVARLRERTCTPARLRTRSRFSASAEHLTNESDVDKALAALRHRFQPRGSFGAPPLLCFRLGTSPLMSHIGASPSQGCPEK